MWRSENETEDHVFTFKEIKEYSDKAAVAFQKQGIKKGDVVMLILRRHHSFWGALMGLNKIGAIAVPATNQLLVKDLVYRFNDDRFETLWEISLGETNAKGQNIIYIPVFNDSLKKGLVITPTGYTETSFTEIFREIDEFALLSYDPCGQDALVKLLSRICVGSWFLDRFVADPIYDMPVAENSQP
jgi:acetyl-CoA synthetase